MFAFSARFIRAFGALLKLLSELLSNWGDGPPSHPPTGRGQSRPDSTAHTRGANPDIRRSPPENQCMSIGSLLTLEGLVLPSSRGWVAFGKALGGPGGGASATRSILTRGFYLKGAVEVGRGPREVTPPGCHDAGPTTKLRTGTPERLERPIFSTKSSTAFSP